jgi:hypothetical protein
MRKASALEQFASQKNVSFVYKYKWLDAFRMIKQYR